MDGTGEGKWGTTWVNQGDGGHRSEDQKLSRWDQTGKSGRFYGSGQGLEAEGSALMLCPSLWTLPHRDFPEHICGSRAEGALA